MLMSRGSLVAYLLVVVGYWLLVTRFTGELIATEWLSSVYDSLGVNLLHGTAEVAPEAIVWEGLKVNGKTYAYFGPFPALVRICLNAFAPQYSGQWSRVSCLLAGALSVLAFTLAVVRVTSINGRLSGVRLEFLRAIMTLGFGFGTPIVYLISCARIYHEAILWGLCGSMWCVFAISSLCVSRDRVERALLVFASAAFVAILSRVTFGVAICLVAPVVFVCGGGSRWWRKAGAIQLRCLLFAPLIGALLAGAWYNYARFGSPFTFFDYSGFYLNAQALGGEFNLGRIPDTVWHYLGISARYFSSEPPFLLMPTAQYERPNLFPLDWQEQTISLLVASPWLILCSALGPLRLTEIRDKRLFVVSSLCFSVQVALILTFYFVTQRYTAEFVPLLGLLAIPWLSRSRARAGSVVLLTALIMWSAYATVVSTLDWNMIHYGGADPQYRRFLSSLWSPKVGLSPHAGEVVYLSDIPPIDEKTSFVEVKRDLSAKGEPLEVGGELYTKGLGTHAYTKMTFAVPPGKTRLAAILAPSMSELGCDKMSYRMRVSEQNGAVIFESKVFRSRAHAEAVEISLRGAPVIVLEVDPLEDGIDCDHANLVMAQFR